MDLYSKINQLFKERKIDWLLRMAGARDLRERLVETQNLIYVFDKHLESHWNIDKYFYSKYDLFLSNVMEYSIPKTVLEECLDKMDIYMEHELNLRKAISLSTIPIEKFYQTKFCDIYLIRSIIYHEHKGLNSLVDFNLWHNYDFLGEIRDDMDDLEEDKGSFNGNRYLSCIEENRNTDEYSRIIDKIRNQVKKDYNTIKSKESHLLATETKDLAIYLKKALKRVNRTIDFHDTF